MIKWPNIVMPMISLFHSFLHLPALWEVNDGYSWAKGGEGGNAITRSLKWVSLVTCLSKFVLSMFLCTKYHRGNLINSITLSFKGLTPILGSAAASCTRRQSCTEDEDEANTDDQMTEDSHADDLTVPPPPSPPCTCGKNLELPPTPPLDDLEAAAKNLQFSQQGRTVFISTKTTRISG